MNLISFKRVASILNIIFFLLTIGTILILIIMWYLYFSGRTLTIDEPHGIYLTFGMNTPHTFDSPRIETAIKLVVQTFNAFGLVGCYYIATRFFADLSEGKTPFVQVQANRMIMVAKIFLAIAILSPLLRSLITSIILHRMAIQIGIASIGILGLVLYFIGKVWTYGIELQTLSDETL